MQFEVAKKDIGVVIIKSFLPQPKALPNEYRALVPLEK